MRDEILDAMLIDKAALHSLVRDHMNFVRTSLATPKDDWVPMIDFNEHDEKHDAMRRIGRSIYEAQKIPLAVVFSSECWIAVQRGGTKAPIQISAMTLGSKHAAMTSAPIERYGKSNNIKLGEWTPLVKPAGLPLLSSFFLGFFEKTAAKAGIKLPGDD